MNRASGGRKCRLQGRGAIYPPPTSRHQKNDLRVQHQPPPGPGPASKPNAQAAASPTTVPVQLTARPQPQIQPCGNSTPGA
ncbi:hypothetical protein NDU88_004666 [Pleurodeles waltl]|uniref:Uncharacterized protein n=1 Tax=Pleurodeles waltl TaxID=8319 RepID=A0AAV7PI73_PLEWA|nr:hypothetical protein NDU88_004666 [Pleurodeles waltl]